MAASIGVWLPPSLGARYQVIQPFPASGGQAELYLVRSAAGGDPVVLKVYRRGLQPKADVLQLLQSCDPEHVVRLHEFGEADGVCFEVLEYGAHGTVRDLLKQGPLRETGVVDLLREIRDALVHVHSKGIIHRDLKPDNILVRSREPLDLMLTDFGIASVSEATQHFTTEARTVKYGAPEAAAGIVGFSSDYWALGLILVEALTGRHPFEGLSDVIAFHVMLTSAVDLSRVTDPKWSLLCRGLLTRDYTRRWGGTEIRAWLHGETPVVFVDRQERQAHQPYRIATYDCRTRTELAIALAENWQSGVRDLVRGLITPWLREELRDQDACRLLLDLVEDRALDDDERLLRFIAGIAGGVPPNWRGSSLDPETLATLCEDNLKDVPRHPGFIQDLFRRRVLAVWERAGHEGAGTIQKLWSESGAEFREFWGTLSRAGAPIGGEPEVGTVLAELLFLIVSARRRQTFKEEIAALASEAARCDWYAIVEGKESPAALLLRHRVRELAAAAGREEIEASEKLSDQIHSFELDFGQALAEDPECRAALDALHQVRQRNLARTSGDQVAAVRQKLFARAEYMLAESELRRLRRRWLLELALDAAAVASIFALGRHIIGDLIAGDGLAHILPFVEADGWAAEFRLGVAGLIAVVTLLFLLWHRAARQVSEHFHASIAPDYARRAGLTGLAGAALAALLPPSVVLRLDGVVPGVPLLGWFVAGFLIGMIACIAIRIRVWGWPGFAGVIQAISDMGRFRSAAAVASRHLRVRMIATAVLMVISIGLVGLSASLGNGYPWLGTIAQKSMSIEGLAWKGGSRRDRIAASAALSDADRLVRTPAADSAAGMSHAQGLRLLRELAASAGDDAAGSPVAWRAKALLVGYLQETQALIDLRNDDAAVRATVLVETGEAVGHYLLGQSREHGLGGGPDFIAAYEHYSNAVRQNVAGAAQAQQQLVQRMLLSDGRAKELAYRHVEVKALAGDPNAQLWMGYRYATGDGIDPDLEKARRWYRRVYLQDQNPRAKERARLALVGLSRQTTAKPVAR